MLRRMSRGVLVVVRRVRLGAVAAGWLASTTNHCLSVLQFFNAAQASGWADATPTYLSCWAPNINLFRDARWGRGCETYGEDPALSSAMLVAFITGLQGDVAAYLKVTQPATRLWHCARSSVTACLRCRWRRRRSTTQRTRWKKLTV